jgi:hypothetical protein
MAGPERPSELLPSTGEVKSCMAASPQDDAHIAWCSASCALLRANPMAK